jgi:hypothetical protein
VSHKAPSQAATYVVPLVALSAGPLFPADPPGLESPSSPGEASTVTPLSVAASPASSAAAADEIVRLTTERAIAMRRWRMRRPLARTLPSGADMSRFASVGKLVIGGCFWLVPTAATASPAVAEQAAPVDVVVRERPPPRRFVTIDWNPLTVFIAKVSVDVVITPADHHGLVLVPFYASTTTAPLATANVDSAGNTIQLPEQTFRGFGGEIGYRYYTGEGGPRGFFVGPSLFIGAMTAKAANGAETSFANYGLAADVGYAALVADRISLTLGGGLQYQLTSKSLPDQQPPASLYANSRLAPRVLLALGCAF